LIEECGVDVNADLGFLHMAIENNSVAIIKLLLTHGANPNILSAGLAGETPLAEVLLSHTLNKFQKYKLLKILLDSGADVNRASAFGDTALYYAAYTGNITCVKLLLERGANPNARGFCEKPMLGLVIESAYPLADCEIIKLLLEHGADVNSIDLQGITPLMHAAWRASVDVIQLLLERGADSTIKDNYGRTALTVAIEKHSDTRDNTEIIAMLQNCGAVKRVSVQKSSEAAVSEISTVGIGSVNPVAKTTISLRIVMAVKSVLQKLRWW
jgi:ankyrin repeat protein